MSAPAKRYKPGQRVPASGQYPILAPDGHDTGAERTCVKGEPFPPIPKGFTYGEPDASRGGRPDPR